MLQNSLPGSFPQGRRENTAEMRIQTAAEGVNDYVKQFGGRRIRSRNAKHMVISILRVEMIVKTGDAPSLLLRKMKAAQ